MVLCLQVRKAIQWIIELAPLSLRSLSDWKGEELRVRAKEGIIERLSGTLNLWLKRCEVHLRGLKG